MTAVTKGATTVAADFFVFVFVVSLQALQMGVDVVQKPNPDALTLADFNVKPYKMEEVGISIVRRFRTVQHFGFVKGYH